MADQIVSLAYYTFRAKRTGVDASDLMSGGDYHDLLPKRIDYAAERERWLEMFDANDDLVPLNDILNANDITVTSRRPVTYQYAN